MYILCITWKIPLEGVYMWKTTETLAIQNTLAYQRQFLLYIKIFFYPETDDGAYLSLYGGKNGKKMDYFLI